MPPAAKSGISKLKSPGDLRLGFVPLLDAAPLIAARHMGYFAEEGLRVTLHKQIGWANMRDKLAFGQLDAGHSLLGFPLMSNMPDASHGEKLVAIMALGAGGNAITLSRPLIDAGIRSAAQLTQYVRRHAGQRRLVFGHVFPASMHHYLLRHFLASGGLDPDREVRLAVIPPPQMPQHMAEGYIDGFCVGEPWNTISQRQSIGQPLIATSEILPNHPEKVLAVSRSFLSERSDVAEKLVRALLRACQFISNPDNRGKVADILSREEYIDQPADILAACLAPHRNFIGSRLGTRIFNFDTAHTYPDRAHGTWMLSQMQRWHHIASDAPIRAITETSFDPTTYRRAADSLQIPYPASNLNETRMQSRDEESNVSQNQESTSHV